MLVSLVLGKGASRKRYAARIQVSRKARFSVRRKWNLRARKVYASEHPLAFVLVNNIPVFAKKPLFHAQPLKSLFKKIRPPAERHKWPHTLKKKKFKP
jgi:hypothetical protein